MGFCEIGVESKRLFGGDLRSFQRRAVVRRELRHAKRVGPRQLRLGGGEFGVERRSEEHTSELQSQSNLVCRLLLEKKNNILTPREILSPLGPSAHRTRDAVPVPVIAAS